MTIHRRSHVFRLATDPVCYLWSGLGWLETPADIIDPAGATWHGAGELLNIPALKSLMNGVAERVKFSLSGVSAEVFRLAIDDRPSIPGAELRLGYVEFDADWQLIGGVNWDWFGIADVLEINSTNSDNGRTRTISLSVASSDTKRSNPSIAFFTDADQKKRSADDDLFSHVGRITIGIARRFSPV